MYNVSAWPTSGGLMACRVELQIPPTTSTARSTSLAAATSATLSSVALSSTNNSTGRPRRPPRSLRSSITILATLTLGNSHEGQGAGLIGDDADSCRTVDGGNGRT